MLELIEPNIKYHEPFLESLKEWNGIIQNGTYIPNIDDLKKRSLFDAWVQNLIDQENGKNLPDDFVPCSYRWVMEDGCYLGSISLRHYLNPWLENWGGHIGYSVRPSFRNKGVASFALKEMLQIASLRQLQEVLLVCNASNIASKKTILSANGKFISSELDPQKNEMIERYVIQII